MKTRLLFIVNPKSGVGKQQHIKNLIETKLKHELYDWQLRFTERRNHARELAIEARNAQTNIVVVVGGDGTVNEVGSELVNSSIALAILPAGSGNGLARHLGIKTELGEAIKVLDSYAIKNIDVGILNGHYFFNTAGVGFDALIADKFLNLKKRGLPAYIKTTLKAYFTYKPLFYSILQNDTTLTKIAFLITFANSSQYGNHATIAPQARIDDGLLDMCILKRFGMFSIPQLAYRLFSGKIDRSRKMIFAKGTQFTVFSEEKSFAHVDGEPVGQENKIEVKIIPKALQILVPD